MDVFKDFYYENDKLFLDIYFENLKDKDFYNYVFGNFGLFVKIEGIGFNCEYLVL